VVEIKIESIQKALRWIFHLLKTKGFKYTYNRIWFHFFWSIVKDYPRLLAIVSWFAPYPTYFEIEVTTKCNLKCIMCEHTYWKEPNRDMSFEQFKMIVDQFPRLKWIGMTGIGESFLNKDFVKMLEYVKKKGVYVEIFDNFYYLNEDLCRKIVELEIESVLPSIDGATKETYEKIRVGSNFDRVTENLRTLFRIKKEMKKEYPFVCFHYIVNKLNYHEMIKFLEYVHDLAQGDYIAVQYTRLLHPYTEVKDLFVEIPPETRQAVEKKAKELGIELRWNADVPEDKPPVKCCAAWTMPFIFVTGHVIPCCAENEAGDREFQKATSMGNIFEKSMKEIWYGKKYTELRKMLRQNKIPPACVKCPVFDLKKSTHK